MQLASMSNAGARSTVRAGAAAPRAIVPLLARGAGAGSSRLRHVPSSGSSSRGRLSVVAAAAPPNGGGPPSDDKKERQKAEFVESLQKGGVDRETARKILKRWEEAGAGAGRDGDPAALRKLFLKQSAVPALATLIQV